MNLSLRYSFRVPFFSKKGKLSGFDLQHVTLCNAVDAKEFFEDAAFLNEFSGDVNKLAKVWMDAKLRQIQAQFKFTDEEMNFVSFTGLSVCRNEVGTKVEPNDPRWV